MNTNIIYRVQDDSFSNTGDIQYGEYDYTDRIARHSSENAWFWISIGGRYKRGDY
jgi:hypothetical protein